MTAHFSYQAESMAALADHLAGLAKELRERASSAKPIRAKELRAEAHGLELAAGIVRDTKVSA